MDATGFPTGFACSSDEARRGFQLFFLNEYAAAETFFEQNARVPLAALGHGGMMLMKKKNKERRRKKERRGKKKKHERRRRRRGKKKKKKKNEKGRQERNERGGTKK